MENEPVSQTKSLIHKHLDGFAVRDKREREKKSSQRRALELFSGVNFVGETKGIIKNKKKISMKNGAKSRNVHGGCQSCTRPS